MTSAYLDELNPQQRAAVKHSVRDRRAKPRRPLLIVAGAGTGKTKTLASCAAHLLASGADPSSILICSFTRRASQELVQRVQRYTKTATGGLELRLPFAGTFHSVAAGLLREFAVELGLNPNFTILGQAEAQDLMELLRTRDGYAASSKLFPSNKLCLALHSFGVNACINVERAIQRRFLTLKKWTTQLNELLRAYDDAKRAQHSMDYDDLLLALATAAKHPTVGPILRSRFKFILVDEYQDTNRLQFRILRRLKPSGRGLIVVGDDAQAIYSFRAATVRNIRQFATSFGLAAKIVTLEQNYRSTQPILAASNAVMSLSKEAFEKNLFSRRASNRRPKLTTVDDEAAQARHVVQQIIKARGNGVPLDQQVVLFRASHHSAQLELALAHARIPFQKWGGLKFLDAAHVRDVLAALRWLENPRDQVAGFRVLNLVDGVGKATALDVLEKLNPNMVVKSLAAFQPARSTRVQWTKLVRTVEQSGKLEWPLDLAAIVKWYRPVLARNYDDADSRVPDIEQLQAIAATFKTRGEFLTQLALEPPDQIGVQGFAKQGDDVLTLSTIHSAKGHEWRNVTLLSAVDGCLPSSRATRNEELEEERRLLYVAITRPKRSLDVVVPRRLFSPRANIPVVDLYSRPTRFIPEGIRRHFRQASEGPRKPVLRTTNR